MRTSRNPLQRLEKTRLRGQARVGAHILGQTIGNAIAYQISQGSNSAAQGQQAPGAGAGDWQSSYLQSRYNAGDNGTQALQTNADGSIVPLYTDANGNPTTTNTGTPYLVDQTVPSGDVAPTDPQIAYDPSVATADVLGYDGVTGAGGVQYATQKPPFDLSYKPYTKDVGLQDLRVPYFKSIYLSGNELKGTVIVTFPTRDGEINLSESDMAERVRNLNSFNKTYSDGYGIEVNFRLATPSDYNIIGISGNTVMKYEVFPEGHFGYDQNGNLILGEDQTYTNTIKVTINGSQTIIDHELGHFFGAGHSINTNSLMFKAGNETGPGPLNFTPAEMRQVIKAYQGSWWYNPPKW